MMVLEDSKNQRLAYLNNKEDLTDEERKEWINLLEEAGEKEANETLENEPIDQIREERKLQPLKDELLRVEMERKKLELELEIKAEKIRIEKAKKLIENIGKIWCDDCLKWIDPEKDPKHFE